LRELQRTGRIGRIQVDFESSGGQSSGKIIIPSNLDRVETAILAATIESVDRVGPCLAEMHIESISDAREDKRKQIVGRATEILKNWESDIAPDAVEITEGIKDSLRIEEIRAYGKEQLPAGPSIDDSEEIIVVEGRADVLTCLRYGIKNCIATNGTKVPETIVKLCKQKHATAFLDGDRGGEMILNELLQKVDFDFVARAPPDTELESLTQKQFFKALQNKVPVADIRAKMEAAKGKKKSKKNAPSKKSPNPKGKPRAGGPRGPRGEKKGGERGERSERRAPPKRAAPQAPQPPAAPPIELAPEIVERMKAMVGTNEAIGFADEFQEVFTTGTSTLVETLKNAETPVKTIIFDGIVTQRILNLAIEKCVEMIIGVNFSGKLEPQNVKIYFFKDFF
jgi:DNA primase